MQLIMKKAIYILILFATHFVNAQTTSNDYFTLYKGGEKILKPVKYVLFDSNEKDNIKTLNGELTYFQIKGESFSFNNKQNKKEKLSVNNFDKIKLDNPANLQQEGYKFYKQKKDEAEKNKNIKLVYPPAGFQPYFKIFLIEKTQGNDFIKYEVNWQYSSL